MALIQIESVLFCRHIIVKVAEPDTGYIAFDLPGLEGGAPAKPNPDWTFSEIFCRSVVELKIVNLDKSKWKSEELVSKIVKAEEFYNGGRFYKVCTLKKPNDEDEEACLLSTNILYGEKSRTKTTALLDHDKNMEAEIARQAKQAISKVRGSNDKEWDGDWIESLEKVEMKKVLYAVDSSGRWKDGEVVGEMEMQEGVVSSEETGKSKWNKSDGANLDPQFLPHANVKLVKNKDEDEDEDPDDVLAVRFFFVPERLQNTLGGTKTDILDKKFKEFYHNEKK
jgi:hypothetical protein